MSLPFKVISLSHKSASLEIREHFAMSLQACRKLLQYARELESIDEMLVISTCNRFEVYFTSCFIDCQQLTKLLLKLFAPNLEQYLPHFQFIEEPSKTVEHLFRVSIGLESQILGDAQIINQVKTAYQNSADFDLAGPFLHRLMHTIFRTHKRITQETHFKDCHASVAQAAKKMVGQMVQEKNPTVLILGTGQVGEELCRKLSKLGYDLRVANRTLEKSLALAAVLNIKPISLNDAHLAIDEAQLVLSALAVDEPFFTKENINPTCFSCHKYFIDLSVPRSIAPELAKEPNITLLNMDHINDEISLTLQRRKKEVPKVEAIVTHEISAFFEWSTQLKILPTIHKMKAALEEIRQEEVTKYLKNMDLQDRDMIDDITRSIVARVVKLPVLKLKVACKKGEDTTMMEVLNEIFNI